MCLIVFRALLLSKILRLRLTDHFNPLHPYSEWEVPEELETLMDCVSDAMPHPPAKVLSSLPALLYLDNETIDDLQLVQAMLVCMPKAHPSQATATASAMPMLQPDTATAALQSDLNTSVVGSLDGEGDLHRYRRTVYPLLAAVHTSGPLTVALVSHGRRVFFLP